MSKSNQTLNNPNLRKIFFLLLAVIILALFGNFAIVLEKTAIGTAHADEHPVYMKSISTFKFFKYSHRKNGKLLKRGEQCYISFNTAANNFALTKASCNSVDQNKEYQFKMLSKLKLSDNSFNRDTQLIQNINTQECFLLRSTSANNNALVDIDCPDSSS